MLVCPEFAGGPNAGLDFIDNEEDIVSGGDFPKGAEEVGGRVVISAFCLDWLNYDSGDGVVKSLDDIFGLGKATSFFFGIFALMFIEGVQQMRKGGLRPVEGWNVDFMDRFTTGGGKGAEESAVETGPKGQDREFWRAGCLVVH